MVLPVLHAHAVFYRFDNQYYVFAACFKFNYQNGHFLNAG